MVAAAVAANVPGHVRAVVLEDPPFEMMGRRIGETSFRDLFVAYRNLAGESMPIDDLVKRLSDTTIKAPGHSRLVRLGDVRDAASIRFSASCLRRLDPGTMAPILEGRWLEGYDIDAVLGRVSCPALLIQGDFSAGGALPDDYASAIAKAMPRCTHVRLPGVGHQVHGTQAETMLRLVTGFLESLD
jgi:pimeloyl-ACP methyl ester carboxylesterase